jgi:hypothetical protein
MHDNEYEKMKSTKIKQPKWVSEGASSFFISFQQHSDKDRKRNLADKRLAMAGLSTEILNQKYEKVQDEFLALSDLAGTCLWVNELIRTIMKPEIDPIMEQTRETYLSHLKNDTVFSELMEKLEKDTPPTLELRNVPLPGGPKLVSLRYV